MAKTPKGADPAAMRSGNPWPSMQQPTSAVASPDDGRGKTQAEQEADIQRRNEIVTDEAHSQGPGAWVGGNSGATPFGTPIDNDKQANDAANARNQVTTENTDNGLAGPKQRGVDARIYDALSQLDKHNDEHWTDEGLPSTAAVQELASQLGHGSISVSRETINTAAPGFTRTVAPFQGPVADLEAQASEDHKSFNELTANNDDLKDMNNVLNAMYAARDRLSDEIKHMEYRRDRVVTRLEKQARENPKHAFAETRRYLDRQQEDRQARAPQPARPGRPSMPAPRSNR